MSGPAWFTPAYVPFQWHDGTAGHTPVNAADLMAAENGIVSGFQAGDNAVVAWVLSQNFNAASGSGGTPTLINLARPVIS